MAYIAVIALANLRDDPSKQNLRLLLSSDAGKEEVANLREKLEKYVADNHATMLSPLQCWMDWEALKIKFKVWFELERNQQLDVVIRVRKFEGR